MTELNAQTFFEMFEDARVNCECNIDDDGTISSRNAFFASITAAFENDYMAVTIEFRNDDEGTEGARSYVYQNPAYAMNTTARLVKFAADHGYPTQYFFPDQPEDLIFCDLHNPMGIILVFGK